MTGTETQVGTSAFNTNINNAIYVGWKYTANNGHGRDNSSIIRTYLVGANGVSGWYSSSGLNNYVSYLADGKFCADRYINGVYSSWAQGTTGYGTAGTQFAPNRRIWTTTKWQVKTTVITTLGCTNSNDIFNEKVGLITMDEALIGGAGNDVSSESCYLNTNQAYWTISPSTYVGDTENISCSRASVITMPVNRVYGVRPVINLKVGTIFKNGTDGTWQHPYEVYGL